MKSASFISKQVLSGEYYFLNLHPEKGSPGDVVCGGLEWCAPDYRVVRNRFRYHSIEYVVSGRGELAVRGQRFPLRAGAMYYYSPTTPHEIVSDAAQPLVKHFVDFCGPRFTRLLLRHPLAAHRPCYFAPSMRAAELFAAVQQSGRGTGPQAPSICACQLELLILQTAENALSPDDAESSAQHTYQRCRQLVEERFLELRGLDDIAAACHANGPYLCRLFRRYGSEPPYQLLLRLKMRHAADLINGSRALVKQAAKATGFADPYHFSRVFKKVYGVSPNAFLRATSRASAEESGSPTPTPHGAGPKEAPTRPIRVDC